MSNITRVLLFDPVVVDHIYHTLTDEEHDHLVRTHNLIAGRKTQLGLEAYLKLEEQLSGHKPHVSLGGSGTTIAFTLSKIARERVNGRQFEITFVGALDNSRESQGIRDEFKRAGI